MRKLCSHKTLKLLGVLLLVPVMLLATVSCVPADETALIESLIKSTEGGKMTFVSDDGETVTITITKESQAADENKDSQNPPEPEEKPIADKDKCGSTQLADILPSLNSIEDIFKTLGIWEDAAVLRGKGYTWSHVAGELGYDADTMYAQLRVIIEERLHQARELGLITQEQFEYKVKYFGEKALKWTNKIFADNGKESSPELADILPSLDSFQDVFRTLGVWEDADLLCDKGFAWSHIAEELGYDADTMYAQLQVIIEERLHHAKELGLINYEQYKYKVEYYNEKAMKWVNKIFAT